MFKPESSITGPAVTVVTFTLALACVPSTAQENAPSVEDLEQHVRILERLLEIAEEEAATKAENSAVPLADERGFALRSADSSFELKPRLLAQGDARFLLDSRSPPFNDTFILRRLRPTFEASVGKLIGLRLTPEFAGSSATIVDAYLDFKLSPLYTVRVGKVKGPVGLERLQSGGSTLFIERAYPTELAPNRDIGVMLQGDCGGGLVSYTLGVFNGVADGRDAAATDVDDKKEVAGRVFFEPFRNTPGPLQGLGFGMAGSSGSKSGTTVGTGGVLPQYRTPAQNTFFQYATGVAASGNHERLTAQGYWFRYSLGLIAEYIESTQELTAAAQSVELTHAAWQATASYVLTGEDTEFRGVAKPKAPFALGGPGWGAFEVVARATELNIDDAAFPVFANPATAARRAFTYGAGLNWYVTANTKLMLDYTSTEVDGGAAAGADRRDEKALLGRFQVTY